MKDIVSFGSSPEHTQFRELVAWSRRSLASTCLAKRRIIYNHGAVHRLLAALWSGTVWETGPGCTGCTKVLSYLEFAHNGRLGGPVMRELFIKTTGLTMKGEPPCATTITGSLLRVHDRAVGPWWVSTRRSLRVTMSRSATTALIRRGDSV